MKTSKRKIKVFLGAYINQTNAQNINCRELTKNLSDEKFEVYTLLHFAGTLPKIDKSNVHYFFCFRPVILSRILAYTWGILNCDVAYLPRADIFQFQAFLLKLFNKKSFKTIENVIDDESRATALSAVGEDISTIKKYYSYTTSIHPINKYMAEFNYLYYGIKYDLPILYVPTDCSMFSDVKTDLSTLKELIFVGNDYKRKRLIEFIELAKIFPELKFHIVGRQKIKYSLTPNVEVHGALDHYELKKLLRSVQLHFLPSRSEGFGKVTIEVGAAGIPSLIYSDYGAEEWIRNNEEGIIVDSFEEVVKMINKLKKDNQLLRTLGQGAKRMSEKFDSKNLVKDYEKVIMNLYNGSI